MDLVVIKGWDNVPVPAGVPCLLCGEGTTASGVVVKTILALFIVELHLK